MDFCEPEAAFREIVCGRQTEIRNPHEVVFAVFPEPVKKPPFIFLIVSAMVALILPVPHFQKLINPCVERFYVFIAKRGFTSFLFLLAVMDRGGNQ